MATSKRFCPTLALHSCWPPEVSLKMTVTASWPALLIFGVDEHRGRSDAQTAASWRATARAALLVTPHISLASIIAFLFAWCCNVLPSYRLSRFGNGFGGETHKHMDKHKQTNTRTNTHTHTHTHTRTNTHTHTHKAESKVKAKPGGGINQTKAQAKRVGWLWQCVVRGEVLDHSLDSVGNRVKDQCSVLLGHLTQVRPPTVDVLELRC